MDEELRIIENPTLNFFVSHGDYMLRISEAYEPVLNGYDPIDIHDAVQDILMEWQKDNYGKSVIENYTLRCNVVSEKRARAEASEYLKNHG